MTKKILVVDDEKDVINTIKLSLQRDGFAVIEANNGREACELAESQKPDLVLMDIAMPEMDGYEAVKRLKETQATRDIPVVMLTAKDTYDEMASGWEAGTDLYLTKPFIPADLNAYVKSILNEE